MDIIKRDKTKEQFNKMKIVKAIEGALLEVDGNLNDKHIAQEIADEIEWIAFQEKELSVEEIQNIVEELLMGYRFDIAKAYVLYREKRKILRNTNEVYNSILELIEFKNEELNEENSNKNPTIASTQRDYMAGEVSKDLTINSFLPKDISEAHQQGIIHFHDADYFAQRIHNCCVWNLEDMLQNGTMISGTLIEKPHSFSTACNIMTQIMAQVASSQYGGQTVSLSHLAPFIDVSRQKIRKEVEDELSLFYEYENYSDYHQMINENIKKITEKRLREEIKRGVQTIQYQIVTLQTTNGQTPFASIFMYLNEAKNEQEKEDLALIIEEVLRQRMQGVKNEKGVWITPAFPKLLYVLEEDNTSEDSKYWYLTKLAAECTAKRMVPDYISEKIMKRDKLSKGETEGNGDCYGCMGCRSFLTPDRSGNGWDNIAKALNYNPDEPKYYGRFNQGVVTLNLVDVALSALKYYKDRPETFDEKMVLNKFWNILEERCELCHRALQIRHKRLEGTPSDIAPILWQHGALARLEKGETIDELLHGGYSTISLGYAGLWECVFALIGHKLTEEEGKNLGLQIMQKLNDYTAKWKAEENIDYSLYGTPLESTTYKFAKCLQKRFGKIEGVTDKNYITNSYHIHVTEEIDAFSKLTLESEFQKLSPGGAISYIEVPNMQHNIPAVLEVIKFIYNNIMYAELNTKSDYCLECGFDGEIQIIEENNKLKWQCPNCGNTNQDKMSVARRTCGYIGSQFWNQGRTQEIKERVLHL